MGKPTCYLILATPRSGSTLLGQGLQASGLAGEPKEFFGHKMAFWMERWRTPTLPAYAARLDARRARPRTGSSAPSCSTASSCIWRAWRGRIPSWPSCRCRRCSIASSRTCISSGSPATTRCGRRSPGSKPARPASGGRIRGRSAPKLGRAWRLGDEPLEPGELAFDYDGIAALVRQAEAEDAAIGRFFATSGITPFRVVYEEFSPRYEETVFELLRWMGITPPPDLTLPNPRTVKLADDRTDEWVARFRELQSAGTRD